MSMLPSSLFRSRRSRGFSLLELMATVAVIAVVSSVAVPELRRYIVTNQRVSLVNGLVSSLHVARFEAVKRSENLVVCSSDDGSSCISGGSWSSGWVVYVDDDRNGSLDSGEEVLIKELSNIQGFNVSSTVANVVYTPVGVSMSNIRFRICDSAAVYEGIEVNVSVSGVVSSRKKSAEDCSAPL